MNTKITLILLIVFAVLVWGLIALRSMPDQATDDRAADVTFSGESPAVRPLVEEKMGDVVKVACQRKGRDQQWVFERTVEAGASGVAEWRMTAPHDFKVPSWETEKFARHLLGADYEMSYLAGEPGAISAADAGLAPPEATITLTDADGKSIGFEIGKPVSQFEAYVRIAGGDRICVIDVSLKQLLKPEALHYRDLSLWNFAADKVTRVEIIDRANAGEPVTYAFSKEGAKWMMESPAAAVVTSKVEEMVNTLGRLRAAKWHDDRGDRLDMYGLDPGALTVRATVVETILPDSASRDEESSHEEAEAKAKKEEAAGPVETVYELSVSESSPIGEDTKVYMRIGNEPVVGTIMRATADMLKPVMSTWREMRITTVDVKSISRIEVAGLEGSFSLLIRDGAWFFADEKASRAERAEVEEMLSAVANLEAAAFVDCESPDLSAFGLDAPQVTVKLSGPGLVAPERIAVGDFTDAKLKRMVYVRRNENNSIAKVRVAAISTLLRDASVYRDRTVFNLPPKSVVGFTVDRENRFADGRLKIGIERRDDGWRMISPMDAPVRLDRVELLAGDLSGLRAEAVVTDEEVPGDLSFDKPAAIVTITYNPPVQYRLELPADDDGGSEGDGSAQAGDEDAGDADKPTKLIPIEVQPPPQTCELLVCEHAGVFFAKRGDAPTVYRIADSLGEQLFAEYRPTRVIDFDESAVRLFMIRHGDQTHVFEMADGVWRYQAEPDWPVDQKKVTGLLLQIRDLRTDRYVAYNLKDQGAFGLASPAHEASVVLDDGVEHVLLISDHTCRGDPKNRHYATMKDGRDVFLLTGRSIDRLTVSLDELEGQ